MCIRDSCQSIGLKSRFYCVRWASICFGRVHTGTGAESDGRTAAAVWTDLLIYFPWFKRCEAYQRPDCGNVFGSDCGDCQQQGIICPTASPIYPGTVKLSAVPIPSIDYQQERIVLEGDVPSPINPGKGCRFAGRCRTARKNAVRKRRFWKIREMDIWLLVILLGSNQKMMKRYL